MKITKRVIAMLTCAMLLCTNFVSAQACEHVDTITLIPGTGEYVECESNGDDISTFAAFTVSFSDLSVNYYKKSDSYYYVTSSDSLTYWLSYAPTGNTVNFMLISKDDPSFFYMSAFPTGGAAVGQISMSNIVAGDYYVAIGNDSTNSSEITGSCKFSWN